MFAAPINGRCSLSPTSSPKNMKMDPPDNIFYSVHITLLNIFPKSGIMRVPRLVIWHMLLKVFQDLLKNYEFLTSNLWYVI